MQNQDHKKVIVTGATGFIGQNLIPYLLEKNYDITAVSRSPEKAKRFKWFSKVKFIKADINKLYKKFGWKNKNDIYKGLNITINDYN